MLNKIMKLAVLLTLAAGFVFAGSAFAEEKTYINGIDFGFPPFGYVDDQGNPAGFDVESVNWIANEMGFTVKHQPMDWDGIIPALNAGKIDFIASGMSATEERAKVVNFTIPYYEIAQVLVVKNDSDLTPEQVLTGGMKIGVQRGTTEATFLEDKQKEPGMDFELVQYDSSPLSIEDLIIGRIQGSAMDSSIAAEIAKEKPVKIAGTFGMEAEHYAYAVRKSDTELLETLNQGLARLMADPYWEELKKKYEIE